MRDLSIPIVALIDQYREDWGDPAIGSVTSWPTLYRVEADGRTWLTDRHWMLPESACTLLSGITVEPLPGDVNIARSLEWIDDLLTADLSPCVRVFAPCFAGTLTLAGLRAFAIDGQEAMAALVTESGERVGVLMPHLEKAPESLPLPVPDEVVALFRRIRDVGCVGLWQSWHLAACLTSSAVPS